MDEYIRRAEVAEERAGRLEDRNQQLLNDVERLRSRLDAAEDTLSRQDRDLREALRLKDEADDLGLRLRRDLERTSDELQRWGWGGWQRRPSLFQCRACPDGNSSKFPRPQNRAWSACW